MWVPASIAARMLSGAASGVVKSTTTSRSPTDVRELDSQLRVDASGQLHVIGSLDRLARRRPHPAGSAGDADPDHAASASETAPTACLKHASSLPMQAALNPSGSYSSAASSATSSSLTAVHPRDHLVERKDLEIEEGRARDPRHAGGRRFHAEDHAALDVLLGALELLAPDAFARERRHLARDDLARFGDVVLARADVRGDRAAVEVLLRVRADGVGEAALLADLAEEPRRDRAAEGGVDHGECEPALVAARDARSAEADVVLLGVLPR